MTQDLDNSFKAMAYDEGFHYPYILQWFMAHGWGNPPQKNWLPPIGVVIEDQGEPVAAAFLYRCPTRHGSHFSALEWLVRAPSLEVEKRDPVLRLLVETLLGMTAPGELVMTFINNKRLINLLESYQFSRSPELCYPMAWANKGG